MWRTICPAARHFPRPKSSMPTLLLMVVRFFTALRTSAAIRFSGMPHRPKPPTMMVAPSLMSRMASSALATTLFMGLWILFGGLARRNLSSAFEFGAQLRRLQAFADVRQPMLQRQQRLLNVRGVGERDIAPHGIRAGRGARHFAKSAAGDVCEIQIVIHWIGKVFAKIQRHSRHCRRNHLRKMTDKRAEL